MAQKGNNKIHTTEWKQLEHWMQNYVWKEEKKNESIILAQSTNGETEEKDRNETCAFVDLFVHTACHKLWWNDSSCFCLSGTL